MKIFSGSGSQALADRICADLDVERGRATIGRFSDGEIKVQIGENIRGRDVFFVVSTGSPVNDSFMELLILIDAARRASAERITAVLPYFGYARQDRKDKARVPITAKLVANLLTAAGADRVVTVDLHCGQIQGFFDIPLDHLSAEVVFVDYIKRSSLLEDLVIVSPDTGSVARAREFADRLTSPLVIVDKRRPKENVAEVMHIIGEVAGKHAFIFDDMIDTAGTLVKAAAAIKEAGALSVRACATHPVFSGAALENISNSVLEGVLVGDSIPISEDAMSNPKVEVLGLAGLIAEALRRIHKDESVSGLFRRE